MWGLIYLRDVWFAYSDIKRTARELGDPYLIKTKIQAFVDEFRYLSWWLIGVIFFVFEIYLVTDFFGLRTDEDWLLIISLFFMLPLPYFLGKWISELIRICQTHFLMKRYRIYNQE